MVRELHDQEEEVNVSDCTSADQWLTVDLGSGGVDVLMLKAANTVEYTPLL